MTVGTIKTQGTKLYFIDNVTTSDSDLVTMTCPTGITGLGGPADQLEDTCLDNLVDKTYKRGLGNPGQVNVPFNFIPSSPAQQRVLDDLKVSGETISWMIGFSDGTATPTVDDDGNFVPPESPLRTTAEFEAYVADVNIDIATNDMVRGTLVLQRSGQVTWNWNGPTPTE